MLRLQLQKHAVKTGFSSEYKVRHSASSTFLFDESSQMKI